MPLTSRSSITTQVLDLTSYPTTTIWQALGSAGAAGNFTTGIAFNPVSASGSVIVLGAKFHAAHTAGASTWRLKLWTPLAAAVATVDVAVTTEDVYTGLFAAPYTITSADFNKRWILSIHDTANTRWVRASTLKPRPAVCYNYGPNGLAIWDLYVAGDACPTTTANTEIYVIDPIFG